MESSVAKQEPTEEQRARIIKQARKELPELDRRYKKAVDNLNRISRGLSPKP
ncbi:MAG TPA: hypothetical protein VIL21_05160 [Solirubrobacterales bacterium]